MKIKLFILTVVATLFSTTAPASAYDIKNINSDTTGFKKLIDEFKPFVQQEGIAIPNPNASKLDPTKLKLAIDHEIRIFLLNEGAGKLSNQLKYIANGYNTQPSASIFGNISCIDTECQLPETQGTLHIGDWVNLGSFKAGTLFDFLLETTNDTDGQIDTYGANPASNPDGLDHLIAYEYKGYVVLGIEDWFGEKGATGGRNEGSDRDFNDVVFVVDFPVVEEAKETVPVPEPSSVFSILAVGAFGVGSVLKRKQQQKALDSSLS
ncbi:DUF4114 domain-containing protein [Coleofasciculus sp. FACHB-1120]|uniref:DUF4114 domain-containing protein n=1 Tax=Coleofasciculus sp. FACHB-1120 TaxID=2692783 RepID=UPI0016831799|nr:DUF4114 domain-containing protein [Coleofasciculus sp. FACHB-1120]MBD2741273.1 DUF4114 domain-containing protein [Coleofasciculus sp. FACHB-1120]